MDILKNTFEILANKVSPESASIMLFMLIVVFILVWLLRKQSEDHTKWVEAMTKCVDSLSDSVGSLSVALTGSIEGVKGYIETVVHLIPDLINISNRDVSNKGKGEGD